MPLNPAYDQQSTRTLPFCLGYVYAQGDKINSIIGPDGATCETYILAEGEWESCLMLSVTPGDKFLPQAGSLVGGVSVYPTQHPFGPFPLSDRLTYYHFHAGQWGIRGVPNTLSSIGPDQGQEAWEVYFPSVTPGLLYSGMVYYFVRRIVTTTPMSPVGIYRSTKCRVFDAGGNVTGYGFTVNPTWQMIETLLRFQIKPQQPPLAGLSAAEKACFDWPAMAAHAGRNAFTLPNGAPRFAGNFAFAADATLGAMMETQLRNCRSYVRRRGGQIAFIGDDQRASVFTFSQRNVVPNSVKLSKKDLSTAANVLVPQYRDLGVPAVTQIASIKTFQDPSDNNAYSCTFTTVGTQPFFGQDIFTYSGGSDDADFGGDYQVYGYPTKLNGVTSPGAPPIANSFNSTYGPQKAISCTGGYVGTQQSRFERRAPTVVQHRSHQKLVAKPAPGITALARANPENYDLGNNTFDQTNRIMKWMRDRDLGTDGPNWKAPFKGTISGFLEAVDVLGNALLEVEPGDVITVDDTASPEFAASYEVLDSTVVPHTANGSGGQIDLSVQTFYSNPNSDISDPPGNSYQTLPHSNLPMLDTFPINPTFYVLLATPTGGTDGSGTVTIGLPDLSIWWTGQPAPTAYTGVSLGGIPLNKPLTLYLVVTTIGAPPTMRIDTTNQYPPEPLPGGNVIIYFGTISPAGSSVAVGVSGSNSGTLSNTDGQPQSVPNGGAFTPVVFTATSAYFGGPPVGTDDPSQPAPASS